MFVNKQVFIWALVIKLFQKLDLSYVRCFSRYDSFVRHFWKVAAQQWYPSTTNREIVFPSAQSRLIRLLPHCIPRTRYHMVIISASNATVFRWLASHQSHRHIDIVTELRLCSNACSVWSYHSQHLWYSLWGIGETSASLFRGIMVQHATPPLSLCSQRFLWMNLRTGAGSASGSAHRPLHCIFTEEEILISPRKRISREMTNCKVMLAQHCVFYLPHSLLSLVSSAMVNHSMRECIKSRCISPSIEKWENVSIFQSIVLRATKTSLVCHYVPSTVILHLRSD